MIVKKHPLIDPKSVSYYALDDGTPAIKIIENSLNR